MWCRFFELVEFYVSVLQARPHRYRWKIFKYRAGHRRVVDLRPAELHKSIDTS